jgi:hypothetical protein
MRARSPAKTGRCRARCCQRRGPLRAAEQEGVAWEREEGAAVVQRPGGGRRGQRAAAAGNAVRGLLQQWHAVWSGIVILLIVATTSIVTRRGGCAWWSTGRWWKAATWLDRREEASWSDAVPLAPKVETTACLCGSQHCFEKRARAFSPQLHSIFLSCTAIAESTKPEPLSPQDNHHCHLHRHPASPTHKEKSHLIATPSQRGS